MSYQHLDEPLQKLFGHIDAKKTRSIDVLKEAVAIKSVSAWPETRQDIFRMVDWTEAKLKALGATYEQADFGEQELHDGRKIKLPNVLLGSLGNDPAKKMVLIYGHLDVQPALKEDGWDTEPFVLTEKDGSLFGRGLTDDRVQSSVGCTQLKRSKPLISLPVNLKFVFEGMEESGSEGLDDLLFARKDTFISDVDYVCISDNYWLGKEKPCITYGLRGICYFNLEVGCATKDLHIGVFG